MNLVTLLQHQARLRPAAPALVEMSGSRRQVCTFGELDDRSARAAAQLSAAGLQPGDAVLVAQPLSIDLYVVLAAIFRAGLVAMVPDPSSDRGHLAACLDRCPPEAFVGPQRAHLLRLAIPAVRRIALHLHTSRWPLPGARRLFTHEDSPAGAPRERTDDAPALITFTSGTTGAPKVAVRTHGLLRHQYEAVRETLDLRPGQIDLSTLPIFVLANLAAGVTSILPDADLRRPGAVLPLPVLEQMHRDRPTRITAAPAFLERLLEAASSGDFASVRRIDTGGGPVFPALLRRLQRAAPHAEVVAVYGSTEAEPIAHVAVPSLDDADWSAMREGRGLLAGRPVDDVEVRVLPDRWGTPIGPFMPEAFEAAYCPVGEPGEIVVAGPHVLPGYLGGAGDEDNKFEVGGRRWHRTGDAGYLDEHGRLWLLGRCSARLDDTRGTLYSLGVEAAARSMPGVRRATVAAVAGRRVLVAEAERDNLRPSEEALLERLAWAHLDAVYWLRHLPTDRRHNAKIDHPTLRRLLACGNHGSGSSPRSRRRRPAAPPTADAACSVPSHGTAR